MQRTQKREKTKSCRKIIVRFGARTEAGKIYGYKKFVKVLILERFSLGFGLNFFLKGKIVWFRKSLINVSVAKC